MSSVLRSMITEDHPPNDLTIRLVPSRTRRWSDGWSSSSSVPVATCPTTETGRSKQSVKHNPTKNEYRFSIGAMGDVALNRQQQASEIQSQVLRLAENKIKAVSTQVPLIITKITGAIGKQSGAKVALQNAMSIAHTQEEALNRMSKLLTQMNELAGMVSSTGTLSTDRDAYQAAFAGFVDDFEKIQSEKFNGVNVFGNTMGDEEKQLLDSLKDHWLAATEKLVQEEYGWTADSSDSWELVIEENGAVGGSAAFVRSSWSVPGYESEVKR